MKSRSWDQGNLFLSDSRTGQKPRMWIVKRLRKEGTWEPFVCVFFPEEGKENIEVSIRCLRRKTEVWELSCFRAEQKGGNLARGYEREQEC